MLTMDHDEATADPVDVDDLAAADTAPTVPELDPEAALLCALLHTADTGAVRHITGHLVQGDFLNPRYGELFQVLADLARAGEPHGPTRVLAALQGAGRLAGHHGKLLADALRTVALLGTPAVGLHAHATDVLDASHRRTFVAVTHTLTRAAAEAPTDDLFDLMLNEGRAMRREWNRLLAFRNGHPSTATDAP